MNNDSTQQPKGKRPRRPRKTLAQEIPREEHIESHLPLLMNQYLPLLDKEPLERIEAFLMWRTHQIPEIMRLLCGEHWMNQQDAMSFLRFMRGSLCPFPAHLSDCPDLTAAEHSPEDCRKAVLSILGNNIEAANAGFFRLVASLMERAPESDDYAAFVRGIAKHLMNRRLLYTAPRGKKYLQKLLLAITDVLIGAERRLPRISELRDGLSVLMEKPPGKREVIAALAAIGLAGVDPPVLEP
jgi:hypothetical protein